MKIFLIGYMGCGKSAIGRALAEQSAVSFYDLDTMIESHEGRSIPEIFEKEGESYFRKLESQLLKSLETQPDGIIASGGGTPCFFDNMDWMNQNGMTIYLKCSPNTISNHLKDGIANRPLLRNKTEQELLLFIEQHIIDRSSDYERANIVYLGDVALTTAIDELDIFLKRLY